jgi:hypothetical protein
MCVSTSLSRSLCECDCVVMTGRAYLVVLVELEAVAASRLALYARARPPQPLCVVLHTCKQTPTHAQTSPPTFLWLPPDSSLKRRRNLLPGEGSVSSVALGKRTATAAPPSARLLGPCAFHRLSQTYSLSVSAYHTITLSGRRAFVTQPPTHPQSLAC